MSGSFPTRRALLSTLLVVTTVITLVLVPIEYLILEDLEGLITGGRTAPAATGGVTPPGEDLAPSASS